MITAHRDWWKTFGLIVLVWAAVTALLHPTGMNMAGIWERSETYAHGYVVLPIALWLIWRQRHVLMATQVKPDLRLLALIAACAGLWLVAKLMSVNVVEQYAYVALLISSTWLLVGHAASRVMLFPLIFLLLMVPNGDNFLPQLMDITADITVFTLRLLGLPVYRDGTFFSLPSGDWSVVEGCSGIRYIISSVTLGTLYAYLTYRTLWKRVAFSIAALIVPVVANGMRAVLIVLIAHYSDMKLALGVDHFIYGWVWFGIVMLAMFAVGNIWREDTLEAEHRAPEPVGHKLPLLPAIILIAFVAPFPWYAHHIGQRAPLPSPLTEVPNPSGWTQAPSPVTTWRPHWQGLDDQRVMNLAHGSQNAMVFLGWYGTQRQGAEMINFENQLVPQKHPEWRKPTEISLHMRFNDTQVVLREARVDSLISGQKLLVWYWNQAGGVSTTSALHLKFALGLRKLGNQPDPGTVVILAAPYREVPQEAQPVLTRLAQDLLPVLIPTLDKAKQ